MAALAGEGGARLESGRPERLALCTRLKDERRLNSGRKRGEEVERRKCMQTTGSWTGSLGEDSPGDLRESEARCVSLGHAESEVTLCHQNGDQGPLGHWPGGTHVRKGFPVCLSLSWPLCDPGCFTPNLLDSSWAVLLFFQHITCTRYIGSAHSCANTALHALHTRRCCLTPVFPSSRYFHQVLLLVLCLSELGCVVSSYFRRSLCFSSEV